MIVLEQEQKHASPKGLEGIAYFERLDKVPRTVVENPHASPESWYRAEFYPGPDVLRFIFLAKDGSVERMTGEYSVRLEKWNIGNFIEKTKYLPEVFQLLLTAGVSVDDLCHRGYPEVKALVGEIHQREKVQRATDLELGNYYLIHRSRYEGDVLEPGWQYVAQIEAVKLEYIKHLQRDALRLVLNKNGFAPHFALQIEVDTWHPGSYAVKSPVGLGESLITGQRPSRFEKDGCDLFDLSQEALEVWPITTDEARHFQKFAPPEFDPFATSEVSREATTIYHSIQALQFIRWGQDEEANHTERYANNSDEAYRSALTALLERFGIEKMCEIIAQMFVIHLSGLHTSLHEPGNPYQPHSDVSPFGEQFMSVARDATNHQFALPKDVYEHSGFAMTVNVKTLFGDLVFWQWLAEQSKDEVRKLAQYLLSLDKKFKQGVYSKAEVDVVALMRDYFPEAYQFVHGIVPEFISDTQEAIIIVSSD